MKYLILVFSFFTILSCTDSNDEPSCLIMVSGKVVTFSEAEGEPIYNGDNFVTQGFPLKGQTLKLFTRSNGELYAYDYVYTERNSFNSDSDGNFLYEVDNCGYLGIEPALTSGNYEFTSHNKEQNMQKDIENNIFVYNKVNVAFLFIPPNGSFDKSLLDYEIVHENNHDMSSYLYVPWELNPWNGLLLNREIIESMNMKITYQYDDQERKSISFYSEKDKLVLVEL